MLNMAGNADGLEENINKSAFMEIQQQQMQQMQQGMSPYHLGSRYPGQQSHMDSFSNQPRPPIGYPFPTMNTMSPHTTYNPASYPFSSPTYQTSVTPSITSPSRDGKFFLSHVEYGPQTNSVMPYSDTPADPLFHLEQHLFR